MRIVNAYKKCIQIHKIFIKTNNSNCSTESRLTNSVPVNYFIVVVPTKKHESLLTMEAESVLEILSGL